MEDFDLILTGDGSISREVQGYCASKSEDGCPTDEDWEAFESIARQWGLERGANYVDLSVVGADGHKYLPKRRFAIERKTPAGTARIFLTTKHEFYAVYEALSAYVDMARDIAQCEAKCSKTNTEETVSQFERKLAAAEKFLDSMDAMIREQP